VEAGRREAVAITGRRRSPVRPYSMKLFADLSRAGDTAVALLVLGLVFLTATGDSAPAAVEGFLSRRLSLAHLLVLAGFAFVWQIVFLLFGLYDQTEPRTLKAETPSVLAACVLGALFTLPFPLVTDFSRVTAVGVGMALPLVVVSVLAMRFLFRSIAEKAAATSARKIIIVGSGPLAWRIYRELGEESASGDEVLGFVDTNDRIEFPEIAERFIAPLDELERVLMHTVVDEVVIALPVKSRYSAIQKVIHECERAGVQCRYSPDIFRSSLSRPRLAIEAGKHAVAMKVVNDDYRLVVKRTIDILGATFGLFVTLPVFIAASVAIKVTSPGPVFFAQERFGWRKRRFMMLKFRTMVSNAEKMQRELEQRNEAVGPVFKLRADPRITPVGRFLRKTSIDELPQLINVLRGEMSLVGPRPLPVRDVSLFDSGALMRRFSVTPGITGLWQVSGRSDLAFDQWIQLDLDYIDRWSLFLDFRIIGRTIPAVVKGNGAC
jgi:exopolysaccharide biosynthesis polyprenyl glycosylphosphotransferase